LEDAGLPSGRRSIFKLWQARQEASNGGVSEWLNWLQGLGPQWLPNLPNSEIGVDIHEMEFLGPIDPTKVSPTRVDSIVRLGYI
jgi:hypothetical protein